MPHAWDLAYEDVHQLIGHLKHFPPSFADRLEWEIDVWSLLNQIRMRSRLDSELAFVDRESYNEFLAEQLSDPLRLWETLLRNSPPSPESRCILDCCHVVLSFAYNMTSRPNQAEALAYPRTGGGRLANENIGFLDLLNEFSALLSCAEACQHLGRVLEARRYIREAYEKATGGMGQGRQPVATDAWFPQTQKMRNDESLARIKTWWERQPVNPRMSALLEKNIAVLDASESQEDSPAHMTNARRLVAHSPATTMGMLHMEVLAAEYFLLKLKGKNALAVSFEMPPLGSNPDMTAVFLAEGKRILRAYNIQEVAKEVGVIKDETFIGRLISEVRVNQEQVRELYRAIFRQRLSAACTSGLKARYKVQFDRLSSDTRCWIACLRVQLQELAKDLPSLEERDRRWVDSFGALCLGELSDLGPCESEVLQEVATFLAQIKRHNQGAAMKRIRAVTSDWPAPDVPNEHWQAIRQF